MPDETVVRTACPAHCGSNAGGILAHVRDGRVTKLEPAPFADPYYNRICQKGLSSLQILYHPDRLQHPLRRAGERGEGNAIELDGMLAAIGEEVVEREFQGSHATLPS